jgi:hypothetical protein
VGFSGGVGAHGMQDLKKDGSTVSPSPVRGAEETLTGL